MGIQMQSLETQPAPAAAALSEEENLRRFGEALDALRRRVQAEVGEEDLRYMQRVDRASHAAELVGRALIHLSLDPLTYALGIGALWAHKQLQATEIGHTVMHGVFNRIEGEHAYRSQGYTWKIPIDEASWDRGHNKRHHGATNVAGRDPDIHFGPVRLTEHTPHRWYHRAQLPFTLLVAWPNFSLSMNLHFTGVLDFWQGNGREQPFDFIERRDLATAIDVHRRALRKALPYYGKEYLLFPALAGPFFAKVLFANWLTETMRDLYSAATIYCGHVGAETARYPEGAIPMNRGHWYAMQVEASNDFEVPWLVSVFCGALDRQIEHHLFPRLPTQRLRQVAPEVRAICEAHGVQYRSDSWPRTLKRALGRIAELARPAAA